MIIDAAACIIGCITPAEYVCFTMDYAIHAQGLQRHFGEIPAVKSIDLAIKSGEIYGFLGPNGAGKTTTLRMLTTLLLPTGGSATVAGYDVVADPLNVRLNIGTALQEVGIDPKQKGIEMLRLQGALYGLSRKDTDRRIDELESLIDIGDALNRAIGTYSGGMKRRLDLAASLIHHPQVLFLDEPTTGLDPISRSHVWDYIRTINRGMGATVFLTTQYLEEADALAERVAIVDRGILAAEGTPSELKRSVGADVIVANIDHPELAHEALARVNGSQRVEVYGDEVAVSAQNGAALISTIAIGLNEAGVKVNELTLRTPTLDDVFLQVTGARMQAEAATENAEGAAVSAAAQHSSPTPEYSPKQRAENAEGEA